MLARKKGRELQAKFKVRLSIERTVSLTAVLARCTGPGVEGSRLAIPLAIVERADRQHERHEQAEPLRLPSSARRLYPSRRRRILRCWRRKLLLDFVLQLYASFQLQTAEERYAFALQL